MNDCILRVIQVFFLFLFDKSWYSRILDSGKGLHWRCLYQVICYELNDSIASNSRNHDIHLESVSKLYKSLKETVA